MKFRIQQILFKWLRCIQVPIIITDWTTYWVTRTPTNLINTASRPGERDFQWTDNSTGDVKFRIYKSADGINFFEDGTTVVGDNTYTATGLPTPVEVFGWKVVGYIGTHESPPTNTLFTGI